MKWSPYNTKEKVPTFPGVPNLWNRNLRRWISLPKTSSLQSLMSIVGCLIFILMKLKTTFIRIGRSDIISYTFLIRCLPETSYRFLRLQEYSTMRWVRWIVSTRLLSVDIVLQFQITLSVMILWKEQDFGINVRRQSLRITISCKRSTGKLRVKPQQFLSMFHLIN